MALVTGSREQVVASCLVDGRLRRLLRPCGGIAHPQTAASPTHVAVAGSGQLTVYERRIGHSTWQAPLPAGFRPVAVLDGGLAVVGAIDAGAQTALVRLEPRGESARLALGFAPVQPVQVAVVTNTVRVAAVDASSRARVLLSTALDLSGPWSRQQLDRLPGVTELRTQASAGGIATAGLQRLADGRAQVAVSQHALADGTPRWRTEVPLAAAAMTGFETLTLHAVEQASLLLVGVGSRSLTDGSAVHSLVLALDAETGVVRWSRSSAEATLDPGSVLAGADPDGRVVVSAPQRLQVFAPDGAPLWQKMPGLGIHAIHGIHLLAGDAANTLFNLDSRDGSVRWSMPGMRSDRVLAGAGVVLTAGSQLRALELDNGALRWQRGLPLSSSGWYGYLFGALDSGDQSVALEPGNFSGRLLKLDLRNGAEVWESALVNQSTSQLVIGPVAGNSLVRALDREGSTYPTVQPAPPDWQRFASADGTFTGTHRNRWIISRWQRPRAAFDIGPAHVALGGRNVEDDEQPPSGRALVMPVATLHSGLLSAAAIPTPNPAGPAQVRVHLQTYRLDRPLPVELVLPETLGFAVLPRTHEIDAAPAPLPPITARTSMALVLQPDQQHTLLFDVHGTVANLDGYFLTFAALLPPEFAQEFGGRPDAFSVRLEQSLFADGLED